MGAAGDYITYHPLSVSPILMGCRELFRWAATLLTSRCFPEILMWEKVVQVPQLQRYLNEPEFEIEADPDSGMGATGNRYMNPVLVPLLDSLDHRPRERITWCVGKEELGFETVDGLEPGVEVYNNYGAKANEERRSLARVHATPAEKLKMECSIGGLRFCPPR